MFGWLPRLDKTGRRGTLYQLTPPQPNMKKALRIAYGQTSANSTARTVSVRDAVRLQVGIVVASLSAQRPRESLGLLAVFGGRSRS